MTTPHTTLYRDKQNGKIAGVCSGIADYTGINAFWVRLGFILFTVFTGFGLIAYLAGALLLPKKPAHLYRDTAEQQYWQGVRQSPRRTAREVRSRFRDIDRRLAAVEAHYVNSNPRLAEEIEKLR